MSSHPDPAHELKGAVECFVCFNNNGIFMPFGVQPRCTLQKLFLSTEKVGIKNISRVTLNRAGELFRVMYDKKQGPTDLTKFQVETFGIQDRDVIHIQADATTLKTKIPQGMEVQFCFNGRVLDTITMAQGSPVKIAYRLVEGFNMMVPGFRLLHQEKVLCKMDQALKPFIQIDPKLHIVGRFFPLFLLKNAQFAKTIGLHIDDENA